MIRVQTVPLEVCQTIEARTMAGPPHQIDTASLMRSECQPNSQQPKSYPLNLTGIPAHLDAEILSSGRILSPNLHLGAPHYPPAPHYIPGQVAAASHPAHKSSPRGRYTRVDPSHKQSLIYMVTKGGHSIKEAALKLGINYSTAKSIVQVHRLQEESWFTHDEEYQPLPRGRPRKVTPEIVHSIDSCRRVNPYISLQGIHEYILARHQLRLCKATIHNYLREAKNTQSPSPPH